MTSPELAEAKDAVAEACRLRAATFLAEHGFVPATEVETSVTAAEPQASVRPLGRYAARHTFAYPNVHDEKQETLRAQFRKTHPVPAGFQAGSQEIPHAA